MTDNKNVKTKKPSRWRNIVTGMGRLKLYAMAAALLLGIVSAAYIMRSCRHDTITTHVNDKIDITPTQVLAIKEIGEWEFLSIEDEEMVDTVRKKLFGSDELIRIYKGTLRLGIDLSEADDDWLTTGGDTLYVMLPKVRLLDDDFIDEAATQPFFESGTWNDKARDDLYHRAKAKMKYRCLTKENIKSAEDNAQRQFYQMFKAMGYKFVVVRFKR